MPATVQGRAALAKLVAIAAELAGLAASLGSEALSDPDELIPARPAAQIAKCAVRTLTTDARREGWLIGKQRSYVVRRSDLDRYIESRRVRPLAGADDADLERRVARIADARAAKKAKSA